MQFFILFYRTTSLLSPDISHTKIHFHSKTAVMKMMRKTFLRVKDDENKALIVNVFSREKSYKELVEVGLAKLNQSNFVKLLRYKKLYLLNIFF